MHVTLYNNPLRGYTARHGDDDDDSGGAFWSRYRKHTIIISFLGTQGGPQAVLNDDTKRMFSCLCGHTAWRGQCIYAAGDDDDDDDNDDDDLAQTHRTYSRMRSLTHTILYGLCA